jgi:hypothetical protein
MRDALLSPSPWWADALAILLRAAEHALAAFAVVIIPLLWVTL